MNMSEDAFKFFSFDEDTWFSFYEKSNSKYVTTENSIVMHNDYIVLMDARKRQKSFERWFNYIKIDDARSPNSLEKASELLGPNHTCPLARKNADPREFRESNGIYMVKKYFTFGFHTVMPDHYHVIIASHKHIDIYKSVVQLQSKFPDRYFPDWSRFQQIFEKHLLETDQQTTKRGQCRVCIMEPGNEYFIVAPHKCFFFFKICHGLNELEDIVGVHATFVGI